jgi:YgiT-type zinc finger domain-containing protein
MPSKSRKTKATYGYQCEYCDGIVRERVVEREAFKHKTGFVILENVPIGICDRCGNRYYAANLLRLVEEIASGRKAPKRTETVPVVHVGY